MIRHFTRLAIAAALTAGTIGGAAAQTPGFTIEATIPLGDVSGRIDHLAIDLADNLLFVAELGNDTVSAVDLAAGTVLGRASGLREAQGILYLAATRTLYVATGADGMLHLLSVPDLAATGAVAIGSDADNAHASPDGGTIAVGFANGLAFVDPASGSVIASVALSGHAEGFAWTADGSRVFVNIPGQGEIAAVDAVAHEVAAQWPTDAPGGNFPMTLDGSNILVGFRSPAGLGVYDVATGAHRETLPLCGDSDDLFVDTVRGVVYAVCGEGKVQTFTRDGNSYALAAETATAAGARTGLFVPELDRLFVAVPATSGQGAAILVLAPAD